MEDEGLYDCTLVEAEDLAFGALIPTVSHEVKARVGFVQGAEDFGNDLVGGGEVSGLGL